MLPFLAFASNGFLVGMMVALSADQLSRIVIPLLFAVFGGSIAAFGKELTEDRRREAYVGVLALSLFCAAGIILGILTVQYRWLSPVVLASTLQNTNASTTGSGSATTQSRQPDPYLRSQIARELEGTQALVGNGMMTKEQGYDAIITFLQKSGG